MSDEIFIQKTFELATLGKGATWPNPLVGSVIVKNGKVIGEGYHHRHGHDHAEIDALKNCTESAEGATVYVNLEPCCHLNKQTPPCAQRLIQEKIKKVVICNLDPNPSVDGKGIELLRSHGIEVVHGVLADEGEKLNEAFFLSQRKKRPFIHLKMASTLDGMTALLNGESQWITGVKARTHVHELRSIHQGVIVGAQTVRHDNPKLNVRLENYKGRQPFRIVFTKSGMLPAAAHLFTDELKAQTLVYTESPLAFPFPSEQVIRFTHLEDALKDLFERKLINLMLEGGSQLATSFIKAGLVDRVSMYINPSFLGAGRSVLSDLGINTLSERPKLTEVESRLIGEDIFLTGRMK